MKKYILTLAVLLTATFSVFAQVRIACIGNSITYGSGIQDHEHDTYPAQLQTMLGDDFKVTNFGVSGTTAQKEGDIPLKK